MRVRLLGASADQGEHGAVPTAGVRAAAALHAGAGREERASISGGERKRFRVEITDVATVLGLVF